ncbi:MAG: hypothetical protein Q7O66_06155 [Dehalococcoidia bacterium]|nr:hypothetical protein [Dehalococcoidia bacterium]
MTRVDVLQEKYHGLSREIIIKWEVLSRGIRDSEALYKVGTWWRGGSYQSRDNDVTLKEVAGKRPETARPGQVFTPNAMYMKGGIGSIVIRDSRSPYEVREVGSDKFALYEGEDWVEDVEFPPHKQWADQLVTSKGTAATTLVTPIRRCFKIAPVRFCEYFTRGEDCQFCNYNSTYDDARAIGLNPAVTINLEDTVEAYKMMASEIHFVEGRFQSGAFRSGEQEATMHCRFVERIASAASYTPNLFISTPPMDRKDMQRLKDSGLACLAFNLEVWGPEIFAEVCPGKAKYKSYERYLEAYQEGVDVFGTGQVGCNFVGGVSLLARTGDKSWEVSRDSLIEGIRWMVSHGVFPTFHAVRLGAGSVYGDDKSSHEKLPPTDYYLDTGLAHHQAMLEYGLYEKMNKLMQCPMDCLEHFYAGEIGMVALKGNPANWLADTVPNELNWLTKFVSSERSPVKSEQLGS